MPYAEPEKNPYPTGQVAELRVPLAIAASWITEDLSKAPGKRPVHALSIDEIGIGGWQVVGVRTHREDAGYEVAIATLREVYP